MPGADAPAALRVRIANTQVSHHRFTGSRRHSLRDGFNGYFALSLVIGLSCHHPRCDAEHRHQVDISVEMSGPHDFAVRGSMPFVAWHDRVHRIPRPTFVTIAKRPSGEGGTALALLLFLPKRKAKYFSPEGWTGKSLICPSGKSVAAREPWRKRSRTRYSSS